MDEVDFTILAATSVLGDLVEKCPPAEACRDAFDRMSKATVQMCMSTTGFSSSASGLTSRPHRKTPSDTDYLPAPSSNPKFATSNARGQKHHLEHAHGSGAARLPKPHFDMALNDLYAQSPVPANAQLSNGGARAGANVIKTEFANDAFGIPRSQMHSPSDYAISPATTRDALAAAASASEGPASAIDPSLLPSAQQQQQQQGAGQQMGYLSDAGLGGLGPGAAGVGNGMYVPGYGDMEFGLDGMEFLNDAGVGGYRGEGGGNVGGLELGFGWGADGEGHDFSEGGNQLDFFDGFYFGTGV